MLKLIRCILTLENWESIRSTLEPVATGMTIWQLREINPETNRTARYRGQEFEVHLPGIVVEIVTDDSWMDDIIAIIMKSHKNGVFALRGFCVFPVEESYHIRNGFVDM